MIEPMGKRRRRSSRDSFWMQQYGGMPVWGLAAATAVVLGLGAVSVVGLQSSSSASPDPNRTPRPVESYAIDEPQNVVISVLGDSYTAGSDENTKDRVWPTLVSAPDGYRYRFDVHAVGGVGYTDDSTDAMPAQAEAIREDADLVVLFGSRNDISDPVDETYAGAFAAIETVTQRAPGADVVVVGFPWTDDEPDDVVVATRDALERAAQDAGVPFVDALAEEWLLGGDYIGEDRVHPNDAGVDVLAERLGDVIASRLPDIPAD